MSAATVTLPDHVRAAASAAAAAGGMSLDEFVADVLSHHLRTTERLKELQARAARADFTKFRDLLDIESFSLLKCRA